MAKIMWFYAICLLAISVTFTNGIAMNRDMDGKGKPLLNRNHSDESSTDSADNSPSQSNEINIPIEQPTRQPSRFRRVLNFFIPKVRTRIGMADMATFATLSLIISYFTPASAVASFARNSLGESLAANIGNLPIKAKTKAGKVINAITSWSLKTGITVGVGYALIGLDEYLDATENWFTGVGTISFLAGLAFTRELYKELQEIFDEHAVTPTCKQTVLPRFKDEHDDQDDFGGRNFPMRGLPSQSAPIVGFGSV